MAALVVSIGLLALATCPIVGPSVVHSQLAAPSSTFTVTHGSAVVYGTARPAAYVTASMIDRCIGGHQVAWGSTTADAEGQFTFTLLSGDAPVVAAPGRRVLFSADTEPASQVCLPAMAATADARTNIVSGIAPPSVPVTVTAFDASGHSHHVGTRTDVSATYRADMAGTFDVVPGSQGLATAHVVERGHVALPWAVPQLTLRLDEATAHGSGAAGRNVHLAVRRDGQPVAVAAGVVDGGAATPDGPGTWAWDVTFRDDAGRPVQLRAGDAVQGTVGDETITTRAAQLLAEVDVAGDRVWGLAPPSSPVAAAVRRGDDALTLPGQAREDGSYEILFSGLWDISHGDTVVAEAGIDNGHTVQVRARDESLRVYLDRAETIGLALRGAWVDARLVTSDGRLRSASRVAAGADGVFAVRHVDPLGADVRPEPGDLLHVTRSGFTTTMLVPRVTVSAHASSNAVVGRVEPQGKVRVRAIGSAARDRREALVEATLAPDGTYTATFGGLLDVVGGTRLEVSHVSSAGHAAIADRRVSMLHAQRGGSRAAGYAGQSAWVTATLRRRGSAISATSVRARTDGAFEAEFMDQLGSAVQIGVGDEVRVHWTDALHQPPDDAGVVTTTVQDVGAHVDVDRARLSGRAPPGRAVSATLYDADTKAAPLMLNVRVDASGAYTVPLPTHSGTGSVRAGAWADVGVLDEGGHRTFVLAGAPQADVVLGSPLVTGRGVPLGTHRMTLTERSEIVAVGQQRADTRGAFSTRLQAIHGGSAKTAPDQRLSLQEPHGRVTELTLPRLTVVVSPADGKLHGEAPAGSTVTLQLIVPGQPASEFEVVSGLSGTWTVAESDLPNGIRLADIVAADASVFIGNGHRVTARTGNPVTPTSTASASPTSTGTVTPGGPTITPTPDGHTDTPTATTSVHSVFLPTAHRLAASP